jgi:hypothetical protein
VAPSRALFDRPIFVVSTPRSGSTLLFETLEQAPGLFSTGKESHGRIEMVPGLSPGHRGWDSNRLTGVDATADRTEILAQSFLQDLVDRDGARPSGRFRMVEKTPKNALRVPFFATAWPDSLFVYLYREVRETLASMMEAWLSDRFKTYPHLPGWCGPPWSLLLVPGWRELSDLPVSEIVARQWAITTDILVNDLESLPPDRVRAVDYSALLAEPQRAVERLVRSLELDWDRSLGTELPLSKTTVSPPGKGKWRRWEAEVEAVLPIVAAADARARAFLERFQVSA